MKRLVALFLVLLLSIESLAAVVSDNDGSAFITKAEFDSLKNNFQSQIDQYNTSIDSKIDGAIASYLAGINMSKTVTQRPLISGNFAYLEMKGQDNKFEIYDNRAYGSVYVGIVCLGYTGAADPNTTYYGYFDTTWTNSTPYYKPRVLAKRVDKIFKNMQILDAAVLVDKSITGIWAPEGARILDSRDTLCAIVGPMGRAPATVQSRLENCYNNNGMMASVAIIDKADWSRDGDLNASNANTAQWDNITHQISIYSDTTNDTYTYEDTYPNFTWRAEAGNPEKHLWMNVIAWCPRPLGSEGDGQQYGMWHPRDYIRSESASFVPNPSNNEITLCAYVNNAYTKPTLLYDKDLDDPQIHAQYTIKSVKANMLWKGNFKRKIFKRPGTWAKDTNEIYMYQPSIPSSDNLPATLTYTTNWSFEPPFNRYDVVGYFFKPGYDQTQLCYFDTDILRDTASTKLKNYLDNYNTRYGFPMYEIEKDGKLEIRPEFRDTSKEYKIWVTNGPMNATTMSDKPTNVYNVTNLTQDADGSVTITSGKSITFDVNKDDIVYMSWTIKNKQGGGKLVWPLDAYFTEE